MHNVTPWAAQVGGLLIGLAATTLWWPNGRIAGITGIVAGALKQDAGSVRWQPVFLLSLMVGTAAQHLRQGFPVPLLVIAGLLTGYGASMARGCTSGHGVCGLGHCGLLPGAGHCIDGLWQPGSALGRSCKLCRDCAGALVSFKAVELMMGHLAAR